MTIRVRCRRRSGCSGLQFCLVLGRARSRIFLPGGRCRPRRDRSCDVNTDEDVDGSWSLINAGTSRSLCPSDACVGMLLGGKARHPRYG